MNEARHFALMVLLSAAVGLVAVLSNRLTGRLKVPVPLLVLVAAAGWWVCSADGHCCGSSAESACPVRASPDPNPGCAAVLFGVATLAHGSGFLAVFAAGIVLGDERAP